MQKCLPTWSKVDRNQYFPARDRSAIFLEMVGRIGPIFLVGVAEEIVSWPKKFQTDRTSGATHISVKSVTTTAGDQSVLVLLYCMCLHVYIVLSKC